jgi:hypothetical protein
MGTTSPARKRGATGGGAAEQARRDQEVLRANKELAAYFRGRRTEREARAALKTIKAFVRDRERRDPQSLTPLPGAGGAKTSSADSPRRPSKNMSTRRKAKSRRKKDAAPIEPVGDPQSLPALDAAERTEE